MRVSVIKDGKADNQLWLQSLMINLLDQVCYRLAATIRSGKSPLIRFDARHIDFTLIVFKWNQSAVRKIQFMICSDFTSVFLF